MIAEPALEIVPVAPPEHQAGERFGGPVGAGYRHRLVWSFAFQRLPDDAVWEVHGRCPLGRGDRLPGHQPLRQPADHGRRLSAHQHRHLPDAADLRHHAERLADALRRHRLRLAQQLHQQRRHLQLHERHGDDDADRPLRRHLRQLRRDQQQLGDRRHRPRRRQRPARLHLGRRLARQHAGLALRLLRGQQARRAGARLAAGERLAAEPARSPTSTSTRPATPSTAPAPAPSTSTARAAAAATPARSPRSSTTSGATRWTTTTPAARSRTPARATPTSPASTACRPPASATASSRPSTTAAA